MLMSRWLLLFKLDEYLGYRVVPCNSCETIKRTTVYYIYLDILYFNHNQPHSQLTTNNFNDGFIRCINSLVSCTKNKTYPWTFLCHARNLLRESLPRGTFPECTGSCWKILPLVEKWDRMKYSFLAHCGLFFHHMYESAKLRASPSSADLFRCRRKY